MTLNRREFCTAVGAVLAARTGRIAWADHESSAYKIVVETDRRRVLQSAEKYLPMEPVTVTAFRSPKSPGGPHDFFSQADYFWPNPKNPNGPYINRDGQSNPENFNDHRKVMVDLSLRMPALTAAWLLTRERRYAKRAGDHLRAWFVTSETRMNPNLEFSQGVHGVSTGRNYGIIDTLHLVEVARAATFLGPEALSAAERQGVRQWFIDTLLPDQLGKNGSFPKELARTKPYSYSIFNFDVMAGLAQSLKGAGTDLTTFALPDGRGLCKAAEFLYPYLNDKSKWPYAKDVEHFDALPVRSPGLLFAGTACHRANYIALWKRLNPYPTDKEIIRNYPIRQPLLWV